MQIGYLAQCDVPAKIAVATVTNTEGAACLDKAWTARSDEKRDEPNATVNPATEPIPKAVKTPRINTDFKFARTAGPLPPSTSAGSCVWDS